MNNAQRITARGLALAASAAVTLLLGVPAQAVTLKATSVTLPVSPRVFPGDTAGAKAANSYCLMCHSVGMVMTQPDLGKATWLVEVSKMKNAFKAPIPEAQVAVIADYINGIKSKK